MRYFINSQFIDTGKLVYPLSFAICAEDGRELYIIHDNAYNPEITSLANTFVAENVLTNFLVNPNNLTRIALQENSQDIAKLITDFCSADSPKFISYYSAYHWLVLCQFYGRLIDLPRGFPHYCRDMKQWLDDIGNPLQQTESRQNALDIARWIRTTYKTLKQAYGEDFGIVSKPPKPLYNYHSLEQLG